MTVAVPASDKEMISKYLNEYKGESDVNFKIIGISGDSADIHRFYVSTHIDNKFEVDISLMEHVWVKEFAECGYIADIDLSQYEFIPAVKNAISYKACDYAVPLYADAFVEISKQNDLNNILYIEENAEDYLVGVQSVINDESDIGTAIDTYEKNYRTDNLDEVLDGKWSGAKTWLSRYNTIKKQKSVAYNDFLINVDENALLKVRTFTICKNTKHKIQAMDVLSFFLEDTIQKRIISDNMAVPVLKSFYDRYDLYDISPYLINISGLNFNSIVADEQYTSDINMLNNILTGNGDIQTKMTIVSKLLSK